jgi:hypothetical protein
MSTAEYNDETGMVSLRNTAMGADIGMLAGLILGGPLGAAIGGAIGAGIGAAATQSTEDVEREQTGGLTFKELNDFGAEAAERGLSMAAGTSKGEFRELYLEMGYDEAKFNSVWESM